MLRTNSVSFWPQITKTKPLITEQRRKGTRTNEQQVGAPSGGDDGRQEQTINIWYIIIIILIVDS